MPKNSEVVFEMLAAGGDIIIERIHTNNGDRFIYHHDETDITGEGLDITDEKEYNDFETPFRLIRSRYPWFTFWVNAIHDDYREYILRELLEDLDRNHVTQDEFEFSIKRFEEMLKVSKGLVNYILPTPNGLTYLCDQNPPHEQAGSQSPFGRDALPCPGMAG